MELGSTLHLVNILGFFVLFHYISSSGVGTNGSWQDMFYAEVTDDMKVGAGGGNAEEGELIEIVEIPVTKGREFIMDEKILKPVGVLFAILWFYENIYDKSKL